MTYEEHKGSIAGATVCWSGDGNNVLTSWVHAAVKFGFRLNAASPRELTVDEETRDWAHSSGLVTFTTDAEAAVGRRGLRGHRYLGLDGRRQCHQAAESAQALSGECAR